jgi:hypothetical protein
MERQHRLSGQDEEKERSMPQALRSRLPVLALLGAGRLAAAVLCLAFAGCALSAGPEQTNSFEACRVESQALRDEVARLKAEAERLNVAILVLSRQVGAQAPASIPATPTPSPTPSEPPSIILEVTDASHSEGACRLYLGTPQALEALLPRPTIELAFVRAEAIRRSPPRSVPPGEQYLTVTCDPMNRRNTIRKTLDRGTTYVLSVKRLFIQGAIKIKGIAATPPPSGSFVGGPK